MPVTSSATSSPAAVPGTAAVETEMFYAEALNDALRIEMLRDARVIVLGEDIAEHGGAFQVTANLLAEFGPTRILQTPISEIGLVGTAVGAALTGMRPVAELMYIDFSGLAIDQIVNQAAQNRFMFGGQARVPLDKDAIVSSVRKTRRCLVVHEAIKRGGYGGEIAAMVAEEAFDDLDAPPRRLAGLETPIPYAQPLELGVVPQSADIVTAARELVRG